MGLNPLEAFGRQLQEIDIDLAQEEVNNFGIVLRSIFLGVLPTIVKNSGEDIMENIAGGFRLIKFVALLVHGVALFRNFKRAMQTHKKEIDVTMAKVVGYTAAIFEDIGLIGLGLEAVKVLKIKAVVATCHMLGAVALIFQIVLVYCDIKAIWQAAQHKKAIDECKVGEDVKHYVTDLQRFKTSTGLSKTQLHELMNKIEQNDTTKKAELKKSLIENISDRINLKIQSHSVSIALAIVITVAVILQFFPPLGLAAWILIGIVGLTALTFTGYEIYKNYHLTKKFEEIQVTAAC